MNNPRLPDHEATPIYVLYAVDPEGHIKAATILRCENDTEALAKLHEADRSTELWCGQRPIGSVFWPEQ